ncbi:MAG TPA: hypothetical protein VIV61_16100 [Candidatus Ozemobacteraceae bacterium]
MSELYQICLDQAVAQFIALAIIGLVSGAWVYRLWSNAQLAHVKLTFGENLQIYIFGAAALIVAMIMFGYIAFPGNADALMEALGLKYPLMTLTHFVQRGMLWFVRLMM